LGHPRAEYKTLLDWWSTHSYGKHCYIGLGIYKANTNAAWKDKTQIPRQIEALRNTANVQGMIFFSSKSFNNNPNGWSDSLRLNYFKEPASIPAMEWLANKPEKPTVELAFASHYAEAIGYDLKDNNGLGGATNFIVYKYLRDSENNIIESSKTIYKVIPAIKGENKLIVPYFPDGNLVYAVSVENKKKLESEMVFISGR
jgi:hypothetical protein